MKHRILTNGSRFRVETLKTERRTRCVRKRSVFLFERVAEEYEAEVWELEETYDSIHGFHLGFPRPIEFMTYDGALNWIKCQYGVKAAIQLPKWKPV